MCIRMSGRDADSDMIDNGDLRPSFARQLAAAYSNIYMCYTFNVTTSRYGTLDDLLMRVRRARQRPTWRRRLFADSSAIASLSTLRVVRAIEQREKSGWSASVSDVAEYMAVEQSTASRTVAGVVAAGLVRKSPAPDDQRRCELTLTDAGRCELAKVGSRRHQLVAEAVADWSEDDVDTLITLLERFVVNLEKDVGV
jgi:DNA-binding MarR family transcriptional regulator